MLFWTQKELNSSETRAKSVKVFIAVSSQGRVFTTNFVGTEFTNFTDHSTSLFHIKNMLHSSGVTK